jgi:hypothetical protein
MGDFQEALAALLGKEAPNLSPPVIARLRDEWQAEYTRWQRRDLSARHYVYIWARLAEGSVRRSRMEGKPRGRLARDQPWCGTTGMTPPICLGRSAPHVKLVRQSSCPLPTQRP